MIPRLSLLVPTRRRGAQLRRFLESVVATTSDRQAIEVVLVIDEDDRASAVTDDRLRIVQTFGPPGRRMGELNRAAAAAASGEFLMLLNDDVIVQTPGWDERIRPWLDHFADGVVLVHVNDTLMRHRLCTFPLVSRVFVELAGGICPGTYERFRIDDHVEEVFNLLAILGEKRIIYLPEVIFEHTNGIEVADGVREYHPDPEILARDAPLFDSLYAERKMLALRLLERIERFRVEQRLQTAADQLASLDSPRFLRHADRLRVAANEPVVLTEDGEVPSLMQRLVRCYRRQGMRGIGQAAIRRLQRLGVV